MKSISGNQPKTTDKFYKFCKENEASQPVCNKRSQALSQQFKNIKQFLRPKKLVMIKASNDKENNPATKSDPQWIRYFLLVFSITPYHRVISTLLENPKF